MKIIGRFFALAMGIVFVGLFIHIYNDNDIWEKIRSEEYGVYIGANPEDLLEKDLPKTIVIDAQYYTSKEIGKLKEDGHIVYTYLNLGSIESFRDYYNDYEDITLGAYENWDDEQWVDVSQAKWQDFVLEMADDLLDKGVDGFFIDNCDVYYNYPTDEIFDGVSAILRKLNGRDTYVLINGGDYFVTEYYNRYDSLDAILDGVNQETVYTAIDWQNDKFTVNEENERDYFLSYLVLVMDDGKDGYALEYTNDEDIKKQAIKLANSYGYHIYVSDSLELN
ncbi:endo alpha-1,4 polygalactosaminidase [Pseudobutyrivibrio xylanivorans]|uniref:Glycoside-hydrolase family GH114 TIM-barrel domain-containing protein n=1 Tax=Pseudobutyrivibrio xylanivorans DSM 14809 TaxID=1123012 RepID=A0A1M6BV12_PSEXY|nr:endo alpha-1,4 polygalactosaminidase [Pseudobutyrivibrio xylanivorans]SHI52579.1 hypothetical protein SAMN02745725_00597 [Pseudobutyrivibrio xylanivorans DSM 14809]